MIAQIKTNDHQLVLKEGQFTQLKKNN
jgi:hypothetical protein